MNVSERDGQRSPINTSLLCSLTYQTLSASNKAPLSCSEPPPQEQLEIWVGMGFQQVYSNLFNNYVITKAIRNR